MIHKTMRSILSVLLAALLLVTSIPLTPAFAGGGAVSPQSANSERGGLEGSGKEGDPYQIATADDLLKFAKLVNDDRETTANAELTANIDLSEICGENIGGESVSWTPIGTSINNPYEGNFNGAGYTISGLYINRSDSDQGLFGYVSGSGKIEKLSVSGTVSGGMYVGGIVGQNNGNVINCAFSGSVSGVYYVGGVVGYNGGSASVENCYNTGAVSGSGLYVGGVVGLNGGSVENCYNTGTVNGSAASSDVGGVVGQNFGGTVKNCYNTGTVTGTDDSVGGVVGYNNNGTVTGCYFLQQGELQGIGSGETTGATGLTADEFKNQNSFTSWTDFDKTWEIESIFGRPTLKANAEIGGTANNPYKIFTATQLKTFRDIVNDANGQVKDSDAHAKLMNDIDLNGNKLDQWTPIGSIINSYEGTFDGNGHKIENLYINTTDSGADNQGLFGYVGSGGIVQNLSVSGTVSGNYNVGGVVGYNNGGTVTGCIFSGSGSVSGKNYVGGVVGYNYSGIVTGCIFSGSGSVSGEWYVGGIAGRNNGTVENCYNTGQVNGSADSSDVGGVVGLNHGTVENCYNTDSVSGKNYVGGVVGYNNGGSVTNSYNTGASTVTGTGDYVGGVVGDNGSSASVENCYNTGSVTSSGSYVGGVVGWNFSGYDAIPDGIVANCYFLKTADVNKDLSGIGFGGEGQEAIQKTADAFHSGEVAYLLEQNISDDKKPVWDRASSTRQIPCQPSSHWTKQMPRKSTKSPLTTALRLQITTSALHTATPMA